MPSIADYQSEIDRANSYKNQPNSNDVALDSILEDLTGGLSQKIQTTNQIINYEIPNAKDKEQWLAGGELRHSTFAGGYNFSPTKEPSYKNKRSNIDENGAMLSGNFMFLNAGFGAVNYLVNGGLLDLMVDFDKSEVVVYRYEATATNSVSGEVLSYRSGDSSDFSFASPEQSFDTLQTLAIFDNQFSQTPITFAISVINMVTNEELSLSETIAAGIVGTAISTFKGQAITATAKALGITSLGIKSLGLLSVLSEVFDEAVEMAFGSDSSFGFGGDIQGTNEFGDGLFSAPISVQKGLTDVFNEVMSLGKAHTDTFNPSYTGHALTDSTGNTVGFSSISGSFTGQNGMGGFSDAFGNTVSSISDAISSNTFGELSDSMGGFQGGLSSSDTASLGHSNDTNGLGAGLEGINTGGLASIGDDNNGTNSDGEGDSDGEGGSFIATAMDKALGTGTVKIYEDFRDNYILHKKGGKALMQKYYILSPKIVKNIDLLENSEEVYQWIYNKYLSLGVMLIKKKRYKLAFEGYSQLIRRLYAVFIRKNKSYKNKELIDIVTKNKQRIII